jgi:hypothetical protein
MAFFTRPSTSAACMPASSSAARITDSASASSLSARCLEKGVWATPTIAA